MNFLEELVAEWFAYLGYHVRRNVQVGPRDGGGYSRELDVVALKLDRKPEQCELVHVETSNAKPPDIAARFESAARYYGEAFPNVDLPVPTLRLIVGVGGKPKSETVNGIEVWNLAHLLNEITSTLPKEDWDRRAVPQTYPLIRLVQAIRDCRPESLLGRRTE
jgi:hypothetical protein